MSRRPIRIAIVGLGKIARDQHCRAIEQSADFELVATVDPRADGVPAIGHFSDFDTMLAANAGVEAVVICTPPQARYAVARRAIHAGLAVFLEKPPGATLGEVRALDIVSQARHVSLFTSWHSRFAAGVPLAKTWLAEREIRSVAITWREDVRVWHPGQSWIWGAGGLGVFDPGINALSIVTEILPRPILLAGATLLTPADREAPIAAKLTMADSEDVPITMDLDWRQPGSPTWEIEVETEVGTGRLTRGGAAWSCAGVEHEGEDREYQGLYGRFAELVRDGRSEVDVEPLRLVADAFLLGSREQVGAFND